MEEFYKTKAKLDKKEKRKTKNICIFKNKIKSTRNYTPHQIKTTKKLEMETGGEG
ncbi:hypothetical protein Q7W34_10780 [Streptococcus suis]|nr:hypothetical protein [Streptococcus suis]